MHLQLLYFSLLQYCLPWRLLTLVYDQVKTVSESKATLVLSLSKTTMLWRILVWRIESSHSRLPMHLPHSLVVVLLLEKKLKLKSSRPTIPRPTHQWHAENGKRILYKGHTKPWEGMISLTQNIVVILWMLFFFNEVISFKHTLCSNTTDEF